MRTFTIYALCDPDTENVRYVGVTADIKRRMNQHVSPANNPGTQVSKWINELSARRKRPSIVTLEQCDDPLAASDAERKWITYHLSTGSLLLNSQIHSKDDPSYTRTDWENEHPRKSINLSPAQWDALDAIAGDLGGPATRGANIGAPSWRTLIRDIADGKLAVISADTLAKEREDRRDCEARRIDCVNQLSHVLRTLAKGRTSGHDWMAAALDAENSLLDFFGYKAQS